MKNPLIAALILTLSVSASADNPGATAGRLAALEAELKETGYSGFFAVSSNSIPLYFGTAGTAGSAQAFTPDTQIDIGSVTKTITGLAADRLIADGKLASDATLSDFFQGVPKDKRDITLHQLLTHGAGLPDMVGSDDEELDRDSFVKRALQVPLLFKPGSGYEYSNVGFGLVAVIIEKVTGTPYEQWVRDNVLLPLGMKDTGYVLAYDEQRAEKTMSGKSVREASWGGQSNANWNLVGNGGMVSTASDLQKLGNAIAGNSRGAGSPMLQPHNPEDESGRTHYGYGIVVQDSQRLGRLYWHNGGNPWFFTDFFVAPDSGYVVIVHSNNPDIDAPTGEVFRALLTDG